MSEAFRSKRKPKVALFVKSGWLMRDETAFISYNYQYGGENGNKDRDMR